MKNIAILGSTGSIGRQALQVVDEFPDEYKVLALAAGTNMDLLAAQILKYAPQYVAVGSVEASLKLSQLLAQKKTTILTGESALTNLAEIDGLELILVAVTGIQGLRPTIKALENKITVALANKETLVTAGRLVMDTSAATKTKIIPVDSEHSAIFQCYDQNNPRAVEKLLLTASGGPFLRFTAEEMKAVSPTQALKHPKWQMGTKITIDSAGLINKGLEVIEAHWLFDVPYDRIDVLIHPQSIIHSMVEYVDGAVLAQCGQPDMRVPIQYALTYPRRLKNTFPKLDFTKVGELTFGHPDLLRFPGLQLAYEAGKTGGTMTTVFNAANEEAVAMFLQTSIKFTDIPRVIEGVMRKHMSIIDYHLDDIFQIDSWARKNAAELSKTLQ